MNNAIKGALLSGLIFPGLGQVFLKHHKRGVVIMVATLVSIIAIAVKAAQHALAILERIESEGGVIDMGTVSSAAAQVSAGSGGLTFNLLFLLIMVCWALGIIDAYQIGRKKDKLQ